MSKTIFSVLCLVFRLDRSLSKLQENVCFPSYPPAFAAVPQDFFFTSVVLLPPTEPDKRLSHIRLFGEPFSMPPPYDMGPGLCGFTVSELARRTRLSKRYVRERLFAVASPEYVEVDAHGKRFKLTLSQSGHELPGGRTAHSTANRTRENAPHRRCGPQPVFRPALQITRKISQNVK